MLFGFCHLCQLGLQDLWCIQPPSPQQELESTQLEALRLLAVIYNNEKTWNDQACTLNLAKFVLSPHNLNLLQEVRIDCFGHLQEQQLQHCIIKLCDRSPRTPRGRAKAFCECLFRSPYWPCCCTQKQNLHWINTCCGVQKVLISIDNCLSLHTTIKYDPTIISRSLILSIMTYNGQSMNNQWEVSKLWINPHFMHMNHPCWEEIA